MLFNSYSFIFIFLPIAFAGMFWLGRYSHRLAALWLGLASLAFYAVWDSRMVLLLLASVAFNYGAGYWIGVSRATGAVEHAKHTLIAAITLNLMMLGYFKYTNFFITSANALFGGHIPALDIILPLGISFFTFTQIAFLVDAYRGIAREYNFIHYLLFVTYFPHLIAGPVLHHKQMMPQFANPATYRISPEHMAVGITIFVLGLAKKVLIADTLADYATPIFGAANAGQQLMLFEAWVGALTYTLQLYFDFSGYSDMAIGLSLMFNVRLPLNFDSPYKALNIIDFWRRWHMTLSAFLRDYLYIPLGGNRKGPFRRYLNLMATMLLGGLWHGAGWTFVIWGGLHGLYLTINHGWREVKARHGWGDGGHLARLVARTLTFLAVVVAWVFFRANSLAAAQSVLAGMVGMNGIALPNALQARLSTLLEIVPHQQIAFTGLLPASNTVGVHALTFIAVGLALVWLFPNVHQIMRNYKPTWEDMANMPVSAALPRGYVTQLLTWRPITSHAVLIGLLFYACLISLTKVSEFLYFQF
ncbi:MBOAT family protein [uncultured Thiodictyon sp.]|uniref:MBOAT family O-acyltransferase n=1 Tax=uncultured Thiodictyon sp. TaxID=1846217 RepID=UPI0025E5D226|nr:MBOAT family protein [uncultured Thiodictyon sp.]